MDNRKSNDLLKILSENNDWMSSKSLATLLDVSQRTIRNYVSQIQENNIAIIEASKSGYKLKKIISTTFLDKQSIDERTYFILSKLLSTTEGVSVFDLAEELMVSESTITNISMNKVKKISTKFGLKIQSKRYLFSLNGREQAKRKMIGYLVTHNSYGYFTSEKALEKIFPTFDINNMMKSLYSLCDKSKLFINAFSMNNLLIHILIILVRVSSNKDLNIKEINEVNNETVSFYPQRKEIIDLANLIARFFEDYYSIKISLFDYQQITLMIFLSVNYDSNNLASILEKEFISSIEGMVNNVSEKYGIPCFDQSFISQLTIHMYNAKERNQYNFNYPNPIAKQVKMEYVPIYDMAVYFSHLFSKQYHLSLSESEISFITLHFGSYLENNVTDKMKISCVVIVENYLDFSKNVVRQIENNFKSDLIIHQVISLNQYMLLLPKCDLLISALQVPLHHEHAVVINPIPTKRNLETIHQEIELLLREKKLSSANSILKTWFRKDLYFRNIKLNSPNEYIRFMGNECSKKGFIQSDFINDVLLRESVSSTAFTDSLSIPHTISKYAEKSFICVIHNYSPIQWENSQVNFVLMIGITKEDMKKFSDALNLLIDFFLSPSKLSKLLNTRNYDNFIQTLLKNDLNE